MTTPVKPPMTPVPRQLASNVFRLIATAAVGSGAVMATGIRMDRKSRDTPPQPGGTPGVTDRQEARDLVFGHKSMTQYLGIAALIPVTILYTHARKVQSDFEMMGALYGYFGLGGVLLGTLKGGGMMPTIPKVDAVNGAAQTGTGPTS